MTLNLRHLFLAGGFVLTVATSGFAFPILDLFDADDGAIVWEGSTDVVTSNNVLGGSQTDLVASVGADPFSWFVTASLTPGESEFDGSLEPLTIEALALIVSLGDEGMAATCAGCFSLAEAFARLNFDRAANCDDGDFEAGGFGTCDSETFATDIVVHMALLEGFPVTVDTDGTTNRIFFFSSADQQALKTLIDDHGATNLRLGLAARTRGLGTDVFGESARFVVASANAPEPASLLLLGFALAVAEVRRRSRGIASKH